MNDTEVLNDRGYGKIKYNRTIENNGKFKWIKKDHKSSFCPIYLEMESNSPSPNFELAYEIYLTGTV